jgi:hypothetical protein
MLAGAWSFIPPSPSGPAGEQRVVARGRLWSVSHPEPLLGLSVPGTLRCQCVALGEGFGLLVAVGDGCEPPLPEALGEGEVLALVPTRTTWGTTW